MKKSVFLAAVLAATLNACSSVPTAESLENTNCTYPDAPDVTAPSWVCNATAVAGNGITAVGYAKKSIAGFGTMRKIAAADARATLTAELETQIYEKLTKTKTIKGKNGKEESLNTKIKTSTKSTVNRALRSTRIIASNTSPKGNLYILMGMGQAEYNKAINNQK